MTFLADENVDKQIVDRIRGDGHTVLYVGDSDPGIADEVVLDLSRQKEAVLITADKDFGEIVFRQRRLSAGVLLIRLAGLPTATKADLVVNAIREHAEHLSGAFSVLARGSFRIRRRIV